MKKDELCDREKCLFILIISIRINFGLNIDDQANNAFNYIFALVVQVSRVSRVQRGNSKHEFANKNVIDVWDCQMQVQETASSGEFVSSPLIVF